MIASRLCAFTSKKIVNNALPSTRYLIPCRLHTGHRLLHQSPNSGNSHPGSTNENIKPQTYFTNDDEKTDKERYFFEENMGPSDDQESTEVKDVKSRIIKQAVGLIPQYGYSIDCLGRAAEKCGYPFTIHGLFPGGPMNLIDHIMSDGMNGMRIKFIEKKEEMAQKNERLGMTASVKLLCQYRLTYMKPFIRKWHEGLAVMALPHNVPKSLQHLAELVDEMWFLAGDRSYDFNYYTKRALLSSVYTTTELYMMTDTSPDFEATMKFLDRRLEDTAIFGKAVNDAVGFGNYVLKSWDGILASRGLVK